MNSKWTPRENQCNRTLSCTAWSLRFQLYYKVLLIWLGAIKQYFAIIHLDNLPDFLPLQHWPSVSLFYLFEWRAPTIVSPSLWNSYWKFGSAATKYKFNTWTQLQIFYVSNLHWNDSATGLSTQNSLLWKQKSVSKSVFWDLDSSTIALLFEGFWQFLAKSSITRAHLFL